MLSGVHEKGTPMSHDTLAALAAMRESFLAVWSTGRSDCERVDAALGVRAYMRRSGAQAHVRARARVEGAKQ
jgi:hypothetical protein